MKTRIEDVIQAILYGTIAVHDENNTSLLVSFCHEIHQGEAAVIDLALECDEPFLLLNDHDARHGVERFGLSYAGIFDILIRAKMDKKIPSFKFELEQ